MKCWNCGSLTEARVDNEGHPFGLCPKCGATNTKLPEVDHSPLAAHGFYLKDASGNKLVRTGQPSKTAARRASKIRSAK